MVKNNIATLGRAQGGSGTAVQGYFIQSSSYANPTFVIGDVIVVPNPFPWAEPARLPVRTS